MLQRIVADGAPLLKPTTPAGLIVAFLGFFFGGKNPAPQRGTAFVMIYQPFISGDWSHNSEQN